MLRILSYIKSMRWLCLYLLISLPALLAGPAHTSNSTLPQVSLAVDSQPLSHAQLKAHISPDITRHKTREFTTWLEFAPVPDAINLVHGLINDPAMNMVQKEAILFRLTQHLRSAAPTAADRAVMLELTAYQSQVQTEHHDNPHYTQPAFNISASAQGTLNEWRFRDIGSVLNGSNLIQLWDAADRSDRGHIQANLRAGTLDQPRLSSIHAAAMQHQSTHPDLAAATAMASGDIDAAMQMATSVSSGTALSMLKTLAADTNPFAEETSMDLLKSISQHADPAISGIALDALAQRHSDTDTTATLIGQLSDPVSGANAALTLSKVMSDTQMQVLQAQADPGNRLLQARIKLILQLRGEVQ